MYMLTLAALSCPETTCAAYSITNRTSSPATELGSNSNLNTGSVSEFYSRTDSGSYIASSDLPGGGYSSRNFATSSQNTSSSATSNPRYSVITFSYGQTVSTSFYDSSVSISLGSSASGSSVTKDTMFSRSNSAQTSRSSSNRTSSGQTSPADSEIPSSSTRTPFSQISSIRTSATDSEVSPGDSVSDLPQISRSSSSSVLASPTGPTLWGATSTSRLSPQSTTRSPISFPSSSALASQAADSSSSTQGTPAITEFIGSTYTSFEPYQTITSPPSFTTVNNTGYVISVIAYSGITEPVTLTVVPPNGTAPGTIVLGFPFLRYVVVVAQPYTGSEPLTGPRTVTSIPASGTDVRI